MFEEFGISLDETTVGRELRNLGYRRLSARPQHHAQNEAALEAFKKVSQTAWSDPGAAPDRHRHRAVVAGLRRRVGQKNSITRRWAKRGTRPHAPHDQRTKSAYLFGAICPAKGKGAGLVMPWCDTQAMAEHLKEISLAVDPGAHAVLMLDQAGWHTSAKLDVPATSRCSRLPPRSPELNPVENVWQYMRANWLSNRVFTSYDDIVGHCCDAWNKLVDQPWTIMSIGLRQWAHRC